MANYYRTSLGERISKAQIDRNVRRAKEEVLQDQLNEHGFNFCEQDSAEHDSRLTCSHVVSVKKCQEMGKSELAWDKSNIKILCMTCHARYDKNYVMNPKKQTA